ncbi:hypothetical protein AX774_g5131 [Zancudomyces culisetae]|uniref:Uncharacterized protein n=1 Tax=Zancudomyces culisetae TaxID=1213189 RepID=A0A1R1PKA9_ZANCU|nr:hypothetical protein AX774_g5131 [Zancudomyces culisetae]|eukprot:OMH81408.1 hypothetical protein AX774_g5131 [Zancudomyces culisetae]
MTSEDSNSSKEKTDRLGDDSPLDSLEIGNMRLTEFLDEIKSNIDNITLGSENLVPSQQQDSVNGTEKSDIASLYSSISKTEQAMDHVESRLDTILKMLDDVINEAKPENNADSTNIE